MSGLPPCPQCGSEYTYEDGAQLVCPECAHEWSASADAAPGGDGERVIKDSVGNVLQDGDTVTVIKDLKVKGSSSVVKVGHWKIPSPVGESVLRLQFASAQASGR